MVFAIDAGNTNIVLGAFDASGSLHFTARVATDTLMTGDQYAATLGNILNLYGVPRDSVSEDPVRLRADDSRQGSGRRP